MLRKSLIGLGLTLVLFTGWLFSDDLEKPDLASVIKNIQTSLSQIQNEMKDLRSSVKQLSKMPKPEKQAAVAKPAASAPSGAGPISAWQRAQEAYDRGKGLEDQNLCGQAIEAFTKAIELDSKNDAAFLHRGACRNQLGNYADAIADLSQSLSLQPNNSQAYALRAAALSASGQTAAAIADASEAIRRNSTNVENYILRASLHQRAGEAQQALEDYTQAIVAAPQAEKAYLGRAALLRTSGKLVESVKDCYKAIELNPADPAAYLCRAEFYIASGAPQPAIADINQALMNGQNPAQAATLLTAAKVAFEAKQPTETKPVSVPQPAPAAVMPTPAPAQPAPAPVPVETAPAAPVAQAAPVNPAPTAAAPMVSVALPPAGMPSPGTLTQAPRTLPPALAQRPIAPAASPKPVAQAPAPAAIVAVKNTLPQVAAPRASSGKSEEAINLYKEGRKYAEQERFAQAMPLFDQAIQLDPAFALAYNARCYAFLRLKQYDRAIADCTEAIKLDASYANAYQNRGVAKHFLGDRPGSNDDFKHAGELQPVAQVQNLKAPGKQ